MKIIKLILILVFFSSCYFEPNTSISDAKTPIPTSWLNIYEDFPENQNLVAKNWWEIFKDESLNSLILESIENNSDIKIAFEKINQNRAVRDSANLALLPKVDANFSTSRQKPSKKTDNNYSSQKTFEVFNLSADASYELDLWGRINQLRYRAKNDLLASKYAKDIVILNITTQVAKSYFDLIHLDKQLELTRKNFQFADEIFDIFNERFNVGSVSQIELNQAQAEKELQKTKVLELEQKVALLENEIAFLSGSNPKKIKRSSFESLAFLTDKFLLIPALKQPLEVIRKRPDIKLAEAQLASTKANLNASRADFFPKITLDALFGFSSSGLSDLVSSKSITNSIGGGILQPIFNRGELLAKNKIASSQANEAIINYTDTIKLVLKEVEDALVNLSKSTKINSSLEKQLNFIKDNEIMNEEKFETGLIGLLELFEIKRGVLDVNINYLESQRLEVYSYINFIKALGGGFSNDYKK